MKDHRVYRTPTARHRALAKALATAAPIMPTMIEHGYSPSVARLGIRGVPRVVLALMPPESNLVSLGQINPNQQEELVRGRLVYNTLRGTDKGVLSAKALGSDRRVNMFTPDIQTGIVVINAPNTAVEDRSKLLDAPEE